MIIMNSSDGNEIEIVGRRTVQSNEGQDRTGQVRSGQDRVGQDRTGQDRTGQRRASRVSSEAFVNQQNGTEYNQKTRTRIWAKIIR